MTHSVSTHRRRHLAAVGSVVLTAGLLLSACGGSSSSGDSSAPATDAASTSSDASGGGETAGGDLAAFEAAAQEAVDAAKADQTPETAPVPTGGPAPSSGVKLVIIPCSMAVEGCARSARSAKEAGELLGWDVTIDDPSQGQGGPSAAVQRAVASGADAIMTTSIDAGAIKADLQAARDAGIVVVSNMAGNADDLYQAIVPPLEVNFDAGYLLGQQAYLNAQETFGQPVKAIVFEDDEFATVQQRIAGFKQFIDDCAAAGGGCELLAEDKHLAADIATTLPNRVVQTIKQHPDYNTLFVGFDAALNQVITQGLIPANLADPATSQAFSVDCDVANAKIVAEGGVQNACIGFAFQRAGYGHVDNINRLLNGESPADQGLVGKLVVQENAAGLTEKAWDGDFDAIPLYLEAWGVQQ
ncbi:MAG: substrate-binding domain-containing protein [Candidatus Nanopelagicales bacterium]